MTARALPVHPSHISMWRALLKHMGQTKPQSSDTPPPPVPFLFLMTDPECNMSPASPAIFHNDSAINQSTSSVKKVCNTLQAGYSKIQQTNMVGEIMKACDSSHSIKSNSLVCCEQSTTFILTSVPGLCVWNVGYKQLPVKVNLTFTPGPCFVKGQIHMH